MTEIYLIRHAQAEGNLYHMMQGSWDGDVTELGRRQIEELALRFRDEPVDAVYSSDLYRARLTAGAATRWQDLPLHTDRALREIDIGPWETLFFGNVCRDEPESARRFMHDAENWRHEGAETYDQVRRRAFEALERIARENPGRRVAVFSHGVTLRCLLSKIMDLPLSDTANLPICRNTAVSLVRFEDGRYTPVYFNDDAHLSPENNPLWTRTGDLRHVPLDPDREADYYTACYADAWRGVYGSTDDFHAGIYLESARRHHRADEDSVLRLQLGDESVGLLDLDPQRGRHAGYGWVSLLYLRPEHRGRGYGVQALARAYIHFQKRGRKALRLHVSEHNGEAFRFYLRQGFREIGREDGVHGKLLLMEKKLGGPYDA